MIRFIDILDFYHLTFGSPSFHLEWSGINALLYYGPTLVHSIGLRGDSITLLVSGGIGIVQLLAVLPAIVYIDRWGKTCVASVLDEAHVVCREETTSERFPFSNMTG